MKNQPASASLEGLTLPNGWKVTKAIAPSPEATGGTFSNAYVVFNDGTEGFLKAFDFSDAFRATNAIEAVSRLTTAYMYERDILLHCRDNRLSKVVVAIEHGEVQVPNYDAMSGRVFYLIFHLADGDVRRQVTMKDRHNDVWCAKALHDVAVGMFQVHRQMIAHQDLKPSNVLVFGKDCRLADFGRASRKGYPALHDDYNVAGDYTYAPPEQLYGYLDPDWTTRRFGCDLYMLGNLTAFLFTGTNVTSLLFSHLDGQFHPDKWGQTYQEVLPYLQTAFGKVISDIQSQLANSSTTEIEALIRELCHPDIAKRGHPKGLGKSNQYSLERYVSRLDILSKRMAMESRRTRFAI